MRGEIGNVAKQTMQPPGQEGYASVIKRGDEIEFDLPQLASTAVWSKGQGTQLNVEIVAIDGELIEGDVLRRTVGGWPLE